MRKILIIGPALIVLIYLCACTTIAKKDSMDIKFELVDGDVESGRIYLPCNYDGFLDKCHLDTGSTYTSLSWNKKSSEYQVSGFKTRVSAAGKEKKEEKIRLKEFKIGNLVRKDLEVIRYSEKSNQDTRVGIDTFQNSILQFDFKENGISFLSKQIDSSNPLHKDSLGLFYINISLFSNSEKALWDTGAELTTVDRDLVTKFPEKFKFIMDIDQGSDATGATIAFKLYRCNSIEIAGKKLEGNVLAMDFKPLKAKVGSDVHIILGYNVIRQMNWIMDFKNNTWALTK